MRLLPTTSDGSFGRVAEGVGDVKHDIVQAPTLRSLDAIHLATVALFDATLSGLITYDSRGDGVLTLLTRNQVRLLCQQAVSLAQGSSLTHLNLII